MRFFYQFQYISFIFSRRQSFLVFKTISSLLTSYLHIRILSCLSVPFFIGAPTKNLFLRSFWHLTQIRRHSDEYARTSKHMRILIKFNRITTLVIRDAIHFMLVFFMFVCMCQFLSLSHTSTSDMLSKCFG